MGVDIKEMKCYNKTVSKESDPQDTKGGGTMNVMRERRLRGAIPTQREVAKIVGVQESAVSKWERGLAKPRADKLPILAKLYGCTIEELLADDAEQKERPPPPLFCSRLRWSLHSRRSPVCLK